MVGYEALGYALSAVSCAGVFVYGFPVNFDREQLRPLLGLNVKASSVESIVSNGFVYRLFADAENASSTRDRVTNWLTYQLLEGCEGVIIPSDQSVMVHIGR